MDTDLAIKGSLANLPDGVFEEAAFLTELQTRGFSIADSQMILEKATLEGYVQHDGDVMLRNLSRA